jgi:hypothetical protein
MVGRSVISPPCGSNSQINRPLLRPVCTAQILVDYGEHVQIEV